MKSIYVDTSNKKFMFDLGMMFAKGEKIKILNVEDVNKKIKEELKLGFAKSFNMMIKYWQDNNLAPNFNLTSEEKKVFLICPVRNATQEEKEKLNALVKDYENKGYKIHYPERDANQNPVVNGVNTGGYSICFDNTVANANAKNTVLFYNKKSAGSMFDLGVTYYFKTLNPERKFFLANEIKLDENDYIDNKVAELLFKNKAELSITK